MVDAIQRLLAHPDACGEAFNVGGLEEMPMLDFAQHIIKLTEVHPSIADPGRVSNRPGPTIEIIHYENAYTGGFEDMQRRLPTSPRWKPSRAGAAPQVSTRYSRRPGSLLQEAGIGHREIMVSEGRK